MTEEQQKEEMIQNIADSLQHTPVSFEFKVKKNPKGIKIIYEVTEEQMNSMMEDGMEKLKKKTQKAE